MVPRPWLHVASGRAGAGRRRRRLCSADETDPAFDPDAPLPGPPDPWARTEMPAPRAGPPYHMTEMIAAEPARRRRRHPRRGSAGPAARRGGSPSAIRPPLAAGEPVVVTGCGTSEHGALGGAEILREALRRPACPAPAHRAAPGLRAVARPAERAASSSASPTRAARPPRTPRLPAAARAGARTALMTVSDRSPGAALADIVVETDELDQGWCHVVGYLSPILAAAAVGAHLTGRPSTGGCRGRSRRARRRRDGRGRRGGSRPASRTPTGSS